MTSVRQPPSPKLPPELLIGVIIALAVTGIPSLLRQFLDQRQYEAAIQSYKMAECDQASEQFDKIIRAFRLVDFGQYIPRAEEKKAECRFFQDAVSDQKEGKFESALLNYAKVAVYEDSALLELMRRNLSELFQKSKIETLATLKVCNRLGTLAEKNLLPTSDANLPSLYPACAKIYEADKNYKSVIST